MLCNSKNMQIHVSLKSMIAIMIFCQLYYSLLLSISLKLFILITFLQDVYISLITFTFAYFDYALYLRGVTTWKSKVTINEYYAHIYYIWDNKFVLSKENIKSYTYNCVVA